MFVVATVRYNVENRLNRVEIRRYPKIVIAKVERSEDEAFGLLFRFISGENRQN
jgi:hypothetical protein